MKSLEIHGESIREINAYVSELDPSIRLEVFKVLFAEEQKQTALSVAAVQVGQPQMPGRSLAPRERLRSCHVSSLIDKGLALAFWMEVDGGKEGFTSIDLKKAFSDALEPAPGNTSDIIAKLGAAGKVMKMGKAGKSQSYRLTGTGMDQVNKWISGAKGTGSE
jgi:hypothetical protein